jgi:hypothetical protein
MKKHVLAYVMSVCRKNLDRHPELNNFPHYSFILKDNKITSWARNSKIEPPRHFGYHRDWDATYRPKYHAELAAYRKHPIKPPFEIINVRMSKQGLLRISKPCLACTRLMTALGCRKFYYSFQGGFLEYAPEKSGRD